MESATSILGVILGAGTVSILKVLFDAIRKRSEGRTAREDTAITRWRELASEYQQESINKSRTIAAYRRWYPRLWAAYQGKPGPKTYFPVDPTQPDDDMYDTQPSAPSAPSAAPAAHQEEQ